MKHTLEALVATLALSSMSCVTNTSTLSLQTPSPTARVVDGKYDFIDDNVNPEDLQKIETASYMVVSESKYKNSKGEEIILHSFGTAVIYKDIGNKSYLATANHVVQNEEVLFSFFTGKLEKVSEQFYLLEDDEVDRLHNLMRNLPLSHLYLGNGTAPANYILQTSDEIKIILNVIKPQKIKVVAQHEEKDLAVISVQKLKHPPLPYSIGNTNDLQRQNLLFVVGYPGALLENVTRGYITSVHDSRLARADPETRFIFDASISPGNSGGGIFAVRDGKLELVGITSAMYLGGNDLYIGVKINGISDVFEGNRIRCSSGWKCDRSTPYELKL